MDRIDMMRAFAQVAQEGSFTAAARRLGLSTRLVSKYVAELEGRLGAQLLRRTTRSVSLTDVGAACLDRCRALVEQFDELDTAARERHGALSGPIRMTAPTGFGATRLAEALAPFLASHPAVTVELRLSDARLSLVEEGLDLAVRIGRPADSALVMRKLADMPLVVCAAPGYLAARGRPEHPAALATHDCLVDLNLRDGAVWRFGEGADAVAVRVTGPCVSNAPAALAALAVAGRGVTRCPLYAVEAALADGRLVALFPPDPSDDLTLYAVYPPNRHLTARVRALIDHLAAAFSDRPWR
jgi:DNA-binding transcriptional LysR family regulator